MDLADTGLVAVDRVKTNRYALILMDIQMPEMDGMAASRAIRALPEGGAVPILAMTANAFEEDRINCLAAGMDDHISKPVEPDALCEVVLYWLQQGRPQRALPPAAGSVQAD